MDNKTQKYRKNIAEIIDKIIAVEENIILNLILLEDKDNAKDWNIQKMKEIAEYLDYLAQGLVKDNHISPDEINVFFNNKKIKNI